MKTKVQGSAKMVAKKRVVKLMPPKIKVAKSATKRVLTPRSAVSENIHNTAMALFSVGAIDKQTMRDFDTSCMVEQPVVSPDDVRRLREKSHVSQPVFARRIGASPSTVKKWESGENPVTGTAATLLRLLQKVGFEALN